MRVSRALVVVAAVALTQPVGASAKGFTRVVLVGSDGRSTAVQGSERAVDGLLSERGARASPDGGYVRLFFVGPGEFPAAPARYYPKRSCVALDWPRYETTCGRISGPARLLRRAGSLARFHVPPTVLARIGYRGAFRRVITTAAALKPEVELAFDRPSRSSPRPKDCYAFAGVWRGPAARARPHRFLLCETGIYAAGRLYPLDRGVWAWFRLNVE
jgi:hypothetical protein